MKKDENWRKTLFGNGKIATKCHRIKIMLKRKFFPLENKGE